MVSRIFRHESLCVSSLWLAASNRISSDSLEKTIPQECARCADREGQDALQTSPSYLLLSALLPQMERARANDVFLSDSGTLMVFTGQKPCDMWVLKEQKPRKYISWFVNLIAVESTERLLFLFPFILSTLLEGAIHILRNQPLFHWPPFPPQIAPDTA